MTLPHSFDADDSPERPKVLLVDDDDLALMLTAEALRGRGFEITEANGLAVARPEERDNVPGNVGTWTFTFDGDGEFVLNHVGPLEPGYDDGGIYEVSGDRLSLRYPSQPGNIVEVYEYAFDGDDLVLTVVDDGDYWWANAAAMVPWERIEAE